MGKLLNISVIRYHCWPGQYSGSYVHMCQLAHLWLENVCKPSDVHRSDCTVFHAGLVSAEYFWGTSCHTLCQPVDVSGVEVPCGTTVGICSSFSIWFMILSKYSESPAIHSASYGRESKRKKEGDNWRTVPWPCPVAAGEEIQRNWSHYLIGYIKRVMTVSPGLKTEQFNYTYWFPVPVPVQW